MTYTIDELKQKPLSELHAIFRNAAHIAVTPKASTQERKAAEVTMANINRALMRTGGPR